MNKNKEALDSRQYQTIIYLKDEFVNIKNVTAHKVTSPSGHPELFRQSISDNCQHMKMWEACGCKIEPIDETRDVRGCNIDGVALKQIEPKVLEYITEGKANATRFYIDVIKPGLLKLGIHIESHDCKVRPDGKNVPNCHENTILDPKYSLDTVKSMSS